MVAHNRMQGVRPGSQKGSPMSKNTIHGIDLTAPGGLEALFAFNRALFGSATMEAPEGAPEGAEVKPEGEAKPEGEQKPAEGAEVKPEVKPEAEKEAKPEVKTYDEAHVKRLNDENAKLRLRLKEANVTEGDEDKSKAATEVTAERDTLKATNADLLAQNSVLRVASKLGADADALLDSKSFTDSLSKIDASDSKAVGEAIKKAIEANPRYKNAAGFSGADHAGSTPTVKTKANSLAGAIDQHYGK
jgi:hypothetical protein